MAPRLAQQRSSHRTRHGIDRRALGAEGVDRFDITTLEKAASLEPDGRF
jgi:hypothetical protein